MKDFEVGDTLPNGALYVHSSQGEHMGVVLAKFPGIFEQWVTWEYRVGHPESTAHGNYFRWLITAVEDFERRAGEVVS